VSGILYQRLSHDHDDGVPLPMRWQVANSKVWHRARTALVFLDHFSKPKLRCEPRHRDAMPHGKDSGHTGRTQATREGLRPRGKGSGPTGRTQAARGGFKAHATGTPRHRDTMPRGKGSRLTPQGHHATWEGLTGRARDRGGLPRKGLRRP